MSIINVSNSSDLQGALRAAKSGDSLVLKDGNYGSLSLKNLNFSGEVKIVAAGNKPVVFEAVNLNKVSNLTFEGVDFVVGASSGDSGKPFLFNSTTNVTIRDAQIIGETTAEGFGKSHGIWAVNSAGFTLGNSDIRNFNVAAYLQNQTDLSIEGNSFSNIAWDAMIIGGVQGAIFEGNDIRLNVPKGAKHTDGIQFWNTGTNNPSSDVVIRGNTVVTNNTASHGIFGGNAVSREIGSEGAFKNFVIEDNMIIGGQVAGIHMGETVGLMIRNNTVLQGTDVKDSSLIRTPTIRVDEASISVVITGNIVHRLPAASNDNFVKLAPTPKGWTISSNKVVALGTEKTVVQDRNLYGTSGDDTLDGGVGGQVMHGGKGNDLYVVNHALDVVVEKAGAGIDGVNTSLSTYTAAANVEKVTYTGTGAFVGTGNALNNILMGGKGADTLDGAAGADTMIGLGGNDAYFVDNKGDVTREAAGGGVDKVVASVSFTLAANIENGTLTGGANLNATGNGLSNVILGNSGNNVISGAGGSDTLSGGAGADRLLGGAGNDVLNGGTGKDTLQGNSGNDVLIGGAGNDALDGGAGNDVFRFESRGFGHDTITGFDANPKGGQDLMDLSALGISREDFASAVHISGKQDALITVHDAGSFTLAGVHSSSISADDFILLA